MSNAPESPWPFSTIGADLHLVNGFGFKPHQWKESGTPIVRIQNLNDHEAPFDYVQHQVDERFLVKTGDLLFAWSGSRGTSFGPFIWSRGDAVLNQHIFNVRFKKLSIDKTFAYWWLKYLVGEIEQQAHGSAGLVHITRKELEKFRFPILNPLEQRKIARILTTLDNLIEKTEALIAKYLAIKQGMMHDLFTRGVDAHGHLRPTQTEAPDLYKQSELGWIPKEWNAQKLGEVLRVAGGFLQTGPFGSQLHSYEYVAEGIPVVMPQDITAGRIITDQIARITNSKADSMARHRLRFNDVVFSRRGNLSRAAAISPIEDGWICGTGCFLLRCSPERLDANWIARQYAMPHIQRQVDANAVGSTMPSLNNAIMERLLMLIPQSSEQAAIGRRVVALEVVHDNFRCGLHKLSLTKTGLMQDLLTGKVRVKVDESEEVVNHV